jgi:hypothetical protein
MPYPNPYVRLVFSGTLGSDEIFSFGLNLVGSGSEPAPTVVPPGIITAATAFMASGIMSNAVTLRTIKYNHIGTDGRYTEDSTVLYDYGSGAPAGSGTPLFPPQVALVVSLGTDRMRGRATHGRFYLPSPVTPVAAPALIISTGVRDAVLATCRTFLEDINTAADPWQLGLVSNVGTGTEAFVTSVKVGRALDTLRSRRNALPEDYATATV